MSNASRRGFIGVGAAYAVLGSAERSQGQASGLHCIEDKSRASLQSVISESLNSTISVNGIGDSYWGQIQRPVVLSPGVYDAANIRLSKDGQPTQLTLIAIPGTVVVRIPDDQYLFECDGMLTRLLVSGITFVGGKGVLHQTFRGTNVAGLIEFDHCIFDNYTECAIGNNSTDAPYLRVRDCTFMSRRNSKAIGIAWGGYLDNCIIESNAFLRNRYHLKLGPKIGGNFHVLRNDFISWGSVERVADIWLVPNSDKDGFGVNSGTGGIIAFNKFGNENLSGNDTRILIALETAGDSRSACHHSEVYSSSGSYVTGVSILHSHFSANDSTNAPLIRSYISDVRSLTYSGNYHDGGKYRWLCEFVGARAGDSFNLDWQIEISAAQGSPFIDGLVNHPVGVIFGTDGSLSGFEDVPLESAGGDDLSFRSLLNAQSISDFTMFGDAFSRVVENKGKSLNAIEVTTESLNGGVAMPLIPPDPNCQARISLDLRSAGETKSWVVIEVFNYRQNVIARRLRLPVANSWRRIRISLIIPDSPTPDAWQLRIYPERPSRRFRLARAHVYQGRDSMQEGNLQTLSDGSWDSGHLVLGVAHIWLHDGRLYLNPTGAPTSATDGRALL